MAVPRLDYDGLDGGGDTDRACSPNVWFDCPWMEIVNFTRSGVVHFDDFTTFPKAIPSSEGNFGMYVGFGSAGKTANAGTGQGGEFVLGSDVAGDNEGVGIRTYACPFLISRDTKQFWFEARIKTSTVTDTKHGFFIGLMQDSVLTATNPIAAAGTMQDLNFFGFHRLEGDGDKLDTIYRADGVAQVNVQTDAVTLSADTYVKIGMRYEPDSNPDGTYRMTFFGNNTLLSGAKQIPSSAGTDFPNDVGLGLVLSYLSATAVSPGSLTIDWWRAAQLI